MSLKEPDFSKKKNLKKTSEEESEDIKRCDNDMLL